MNKYGKILKNEYKIKNLSPEMAPKVYIYKKIHIVEIFWGGVVTPPTPPPL